MAAVRHLEFVMLEGHLTAFSTVQNLVGVLEVWGFDPLNGKKSHRDPQTHFLAPKHVI